MMDIERFKQLMAELNISPLPTSNEIIEDLERFIECVKIEKLIDDIRKEV
jgi:hypothetical protein